MVVFSLGFRFPGCDGGQSLIGVAFIPDNGVGREAFGQRLGITGVFERDIQSNGGRKRERHGASFWLLRAMKDSAMLTK
jgi:hypothetical protein